MSNNTFAHVVLPGQDAATIGVPDHVARDLADIPHHAFEIDPNFADTAEFTVHYQWPPEHSANTIVVHGKRNGETRTALCVALASTRLDTNRAVKAALDVRKVSFAPLDVAIAETRMEHGSITPFGAPADWPILIDERVARAGLVVLGGGKRLLKVVVDGQSLHALPNAQVISDLAI